MPRRSSSRLDLAGRICGYIHEQRLAPGDRVNEKRLAEWLGVSRTPVRAALEELAAHGYVERRSNLGMTLVKPPPLPRPAAPASWMSWSCAWRATVTRACWPSSSPRAT